MRNRQTYLSQSIIKYKYSHSKFSTLPFLKKMLDFTPEVEIAPGIFLSKPIKNSQKSEIERERQQQQAKVEEEFRQKAADTASLAVLEQDLEDERNSVNKLLESNQVKNLKGTNGCFLIENNVSTFK
jgi:hypothetical protein